MNEAFEAELRDFATRALAEDIGAGDYSSLAAIPAGTTGTAELIIKDDAVVGGIEVARTIYDLVDKDLTIDWKVRDGDIVKKGTRGYTVTGSVHTILKTERLILNFMQRLSGIATDTRELVRLVEGTGCIILDTRKTTPNLRFLEKWAVRIGGGRNHRFGLYDMVMLKDNHVDYAGGISNAIEQTVVYLAENKLDLKIEIETRNLEEVKEVLKHGKVHRIMLDNFDPARVKEAVDLIGKRVETEASGGINKQNIRAYAETGVDYISVGALTHSVKSIDISLKVLEN